MGNKDLTMIGHGTHGCYIKLSKEAYEFWNNVIEEHGDNLLIDYMIKFDEDGYDIEDVEEIEDIPEYAQFMKDEEGNEYHWNDYPLSLTYWDGLAHCFISSRGDLNSKINVEEKEYLTTEFQTKGKEYSISGDAEYIVKFWRSYKAYLPYTIQLDGEFKPDKLKLLTTNYRFIGEVIKGIEYDGVECDLSDGEKDTFNFEVRLFTPFSKYWENGNPKVLGSYKDGKEIEKWRYYTQDGCLMRTEIYLDGKYIRTEYPGWDIF